MQRVKKPGDAPVKPVIIRITNQDVKERLDSMKDKVSGVLPGTPRPKFDFFQIKVEEEKK